MGEVDAFDALPVPAAVLDAEDKVVRANRCFEEEVSPLFKLRSMPFLDTAADTGATNALRDALHAARCAAAPKRIKVKDANLLTMRGADGFPVARHFDLTLSRAPDGGIVLVAEAVTEADEEQRAKDAECARKRAQARVGGGACAHARLRHAAAPSAHALMLCARACVLARGLAAGSKTFCRGRPSRCTG